MKDIYDFAYPSRRVALQTPRSRPVLLMYRGADAYELMKSSEALNGQNLPREAWDATRV